MAREPRRLGRRRSSRTWAMRPRSLERISCSPSLTAIPAASWPRCWSENTPSAVTAAASVPGITAPKMPHISGGRSGATRRFLGHGSRFDAEGPSQAVVPSVAEIGDRHVACVRDAGTAFLRCAGGALTRQLDTQPIPADRADGRGRQSELPSQQFERRCVTRLARENEAARALAAELDRGRAGNSEPETGAEPAPHAAFGDCHGDTAARTILGRYDQSAPDGLADERLQSGLAVQIQARSGALGRETGEGGVGRAGEPGPTLPDEHHTIALVLEHRDRK